jgi:hypothetical protein
MIPDCYDPVYQEERRQREWDEFADELPTCYLCRRRLYPGDKFYVAKLFIVCTRCKDELDENEETVEV